MSITRHFFRELRPLIQLLEEPLGRSPAYYGPSRSVFDHPFFHSPVGLRPVVDVTEEGDSYVLEAELPGVKKENVEVRIGEGGRSVTIEGKVLARRGGDQVVEGKTAEDPAGAPVESAGEEPTSNQITAERSFTGRSTFSRTVWLPRPVNGNNVVAKLNDGILQLTIPKAEEKGTFKVPIQ